MMEFAAVTKAASVVAAIGTIGGGALYMDHRHAPITVVSELAVGRIFDLVDKAREDENPEWICRAIEQEFIQLCTEIQDHYLCTDPDAKRELKKKAGCA